MACVSGVVRRPITRKATVNSKSLLSHETELRFAVLGGPGDPLTPVFFLKILAGKSIQELQKFWW